MTLEEDEIQEEENESFWMSIKLGKVPQCELCHGILRPDVVFFGEVFEIFFQTPLLSI
jgi:NAD-dependent SIR2 family protein deacetylase